MCYIFCCIQQPHCNLDTPTAHPYFQHLSPYVGCQNYNLTEEIGAICRMSEGLVCPVTFFEHRLSQRVGCQNYNQQKRQGRYVGCQNDWYVQLHSVNIAYRSV